MFLVFGFLTALQRLFQRQITLTGEFFELVLSPALLTFFVPFHELCDHFLPELHLVNKGYSAISHLGGEPVASRHRI